MRQWSELGSTRPRDVCLHWVMGTNSIQWKQSYSVLSELELKWGINSIYSSWKYLKYQITCSLKVTFALVRLQWAELTMPKKERDTLTESPSSFPDLCFFDRGSHWESWLCITVRHQGRLRLHAPEPTWKRECADSIAATCPFRHTANRFSRHFFSRPRAGEAHSDGWQGVGSEKWTRCEGHYGNRGVVCQGRVNSKEQRTPARGCVRLANQTWAHHLGNSSLKYAALCYGMTV